MRTSKRLTAFVLVIAGTAAITKTGHAQSSATNRPMADVLLLVDTSGSMERMTDNTMPSDNVGVTPGGLPNACSPGVESNPNRWGMLVQALTGNMQPFYSCSAMDRSGAAFNNEYKIAGVNPYDTGYFLPYHRPLTGVYSAALGTQNVCGIGPRRLPGGGDGTSGVGPLKRGYATPVGQGGDVRDFPDDVFQQARWSHMSTKYAADQGLDNPLGAQECSFSQAPDGQLDAARDYVRFALMTFDNDTSGGIGVNGGAWPPQGGVQTGGGFPFLGQWSYLRDPSNTNEYNQSFDVNGSAVGLPFGCSPPKQPFEVGARHWGAPPWEGRMIPFPPPDASLLDVQRVNEQIQNVLLSTRPYGATPIDGMMDDARDYLWYNGIGPKSDAYVTAAGCRDQYIVLLTDGAPNLNMRPSCQGGGICPYPDDATATAAALYADTTRRVTTFVIGFSVNGSSAVGGDGFPAPYNVAGSNNCKSWYAGVGGTPTAMAAACASPIPPIGSTAEACCELNKIAYAGTGGAAAPTTAPAVGPFFAESQADITLAFGRILANITKAVSTRTLPTYTPSVYTSGSFGGGAVTAQFLASFIPNAQKPWSGEISRDRSTCTGTPLAPTAVTPSLNEGDSEAVNLATQGAANRLYMTLVPDTYTAGTAVGNPASTTVIDAARSVRPFYTAGASGALPADGVPEYSGTERAAQDWNLKDTPSTGDADFRRALEIDKTTCKRGRAVDTGSTGTRQVPALDADNGEACTDVVFGFATAHAGAINRTGHIVGGASASYNFNIRCNGTGGTPNAGSCSISGGTCTVTGTSACPIVGEVCVPECAPLGAIFRANPTITGAPDALLRDVGYRAFQAARVNRKPALFAATTDGVLHAFKATEQHPNAHHELWSFIPPAVLPRLASNYPAGNQILLDGSPIVKDTVWERGVGDLDASAGTTPGAKWHTTLVAGLGASGGGYYAVNVTDSDCGSPATSTTNECTSSGTSGYEAPAKGNLDQAGAADYGAATGAKRGPHFLWQLTDFPRGAAATDTAKVVRTTKEGTPMVSLFGKQTGTPAITTLQVKVDGVSKQVGVAILPGGLDGTPLTGLSCPRAATASDLATDSTMLLRSDVRRWATNCTGAGSAVAGRGVTIVRLDNGQIIRHFGRETDTPEALRTAGVWNAAPFDSPMSGTPVVYPQTIGAVGQKIFIGDADGTLWRIDVTSDNPANWKAMLFADLIGFTGKGADDSQPIQIPPVISLESGGSLVINAATGDQDNILYKSGDTNYVFSIQETRPTDTTAPKALVKWYEVLTNGTRVTGPMTVFDRTLYFATFAPRNPATGGAGQCDNAGTALLWGLNYFLADGGSKTSGGAPMWCQDILTSGVCNVGASTPLVKNGAVDSAIAGNVIPGVTLRASQACSTIDTSTAEGTGNSGFGALTPSQYNLTYGVGKARPPATGFPPAAMTMSTKRPLPRIATTVNAWALVIE